ncbi:hypothetical protein V495_02316, partial [Pseudogymnoascus sp. VKM F-4514 (FW-929)]
MEPTAADAGGNGEAVLDTSAKPQSPQNLDIPQPLEVDQPQLQEEVAEAAPQEATIAEDTAPPKASLSSKVCGVCNDQQAKYKCSRCEIPYCSVACATLHRAVPCEAPVARSLTPPAADPAPQNGSTRPLPGTVAGSSQGNIFSVLERQHLFRAGEFAEAAGAVYHVSTSTRPVTGCLQCYASADGGLEPGVSVSAAIPE